MAQVFPSFSSAAIAATPTFAQVKAAHRPSDGWLLDRNGEVLHQLRIDPKVRRLEWVTLKALSPAMKNALLASEDRRFFEHSGVDWKAFVAAAFENLWRDRPRGASTITMQLAGMLDPHLAMKGGSRTLGQKWDQVKAARELERRWSKEQILEAYLNRVGFRGEFAGIAAVSRGLFGKHPSGLDAAESSLLAALLRGPNAAPDKVAARACGVAANLPEPRPDCARITALAQADLGGRPIEPVAALAPHVARRLLKVPGTRVRSTLDGGLQRFAVAALNHQLAELGDRNVEDGAVVVLDNRTGEVLAYVGSSLATSDAPEVDGADAPRQAGSTLKPFLYSLAIEKRLLTAASLLDDSPLAIETPAGQYLPQNYDRDFKGWVSLRTALGSSLNVPAVRTLLLTDIEPFQERLLALGLATITEPAEHYGYGLALGGVEVRLIDLVNAYRALANGGLWRPVSWQEGKMTKPRRVVEPGSAFIVGDILADREARALGFGLDNALVTRSWSAVKTGTSKDMRDNWALGWTARYTVGVWVGNFSGEAMHDVSGVTGAAPVWQAIVEYLHRDTGSPSPRIPLGVVGQMVRFEPAVEPPRVEFFRAGTQESVVTLARGEALMPRIASPGHGAILAVDPDIPPERQRVWFEMRPRRDELEWRLDGNRLDAASLRPDGSAAWAPQPGNHCLSVVDEWETPLDTARFEVRGNLR